MTDLATRILDCVPAGSYAIDALFRLVDIVETGEIPTAAIQGGSQPRLLVNPSFVARHAATPERLLMLVLHELHHVILGHARSFHIRSSLDHVVADAVINAFLCRAFPDPRGIALLTDLYPDDEVPSALLRPAAGWQPDRPAPRNAHLDAQGYGRLASVHEALYSPAGISYEEVAAALREVLPDDAGDELLFLGGHGDGDLLHGGLDLRAPALVDVTRQVVTGWPKRSPGPGRVVGSADFREAFAPPAPVAENRRILRRLLVWAAGERHGGQHRQLIERAATTLAPFPSRSRRDVVLGILGSPILLHEGTTPRPAFDRTGERVHVYLDVSGSMMHDLPVLAGAVTECARFVHPVVHAFSTAVADATLDEVRRGRLPTTGGTDIACVAEHARRTGVRRAVIITDGDVGRPTKHDRATLERIRLAAAWTQGSRSADLAGLVGEAARLVATR